MTDHVHLSRFARDVRVLDRTAEAAETPTSGHLGVLRPFSGLLQPGLTTGQWPPPALSHLALADLLARPQSGESTRRGRSEPASGRPSSSGSDADGVEESPEPTVREVLRQAGTEAAEEREATGPRGGERPGPPNPATMAPREWSRSEGAGARDLSGEAAVPAREPATGGADVAATGDAPAGIDAPSVVEPRTVLRQVVTRGEAADDGSTAGTGSTRTAGRPGRAPTSITRPRTILRQSSVGVDSGPGDTGSQPRSSDESGPTPAAVADDPAASPSPVDLTVADVPPEPGALAGSGDPPDSASRPGPPSPALDQMDRPRSPSPDQGTGDHPAANDIPMTVRRPAQGPDGGSRGSRPGAQSGPTVTGGDATSGREATTRDGTEDTSLRADTGAASEGSTPFEGLAEDAGSPERVVGRAIESPRVVDRLYRAIERRRRIERERGGRR